MFRDPVFLGGGAILEPETRTYRPFKWVDGKMVLGDSVPYPEPEPRDLVGFSIFERVLSEAEIEKSKKQLSK